VSQTAVFALSVLALLAVPGPTNTLLAGAGATRGVLRSLPLLVGELAGYNIAIAALRQALGTVISETSGAQILLKFAITAYLIFLAVRLWRALPTDGGSAFTVRRVFVTTLLNPKALIFALVIFPPQPVPIALYFVAFSIMVVAVGTTWIVGGSLLTRLVSARFSLVAPRACAVALALFSIAVVSGLLDS
jgi:threonine/homoserine/homoserine lactone efflux protein